MENMEIARIFFHRSISSPLQNGSNVTAQLSLCSEFSGIIPGLMQRSVIRVKCVSMNSEEGDYILNYNCRVIGDICTVKINLETCTAAKFEFDCVESPPGFRVLPLLSEEVKFCENPQPNIICSSYRPFMYSDFDGLPCKIIIKEDRGLTMGSHLWDSSVVVFTHFNRLLSSCRELPAYRERKLVGVELGAGCGLTGIQMEKSQMFSHSYCSDLSSQIPLMKENVALNSSDVTVTVHELDWCNTEHLERFKAQLLPQKVDVIFAADVLYQPSVFDDLLSVIRALSHPNHTVIFVAQKIRGLSSTESIDMQALVGFESEIFLTESNVTLWRLVRQQV